MPTRRLGKLAIAAAMGSILLTACGGASTDSAAKGKPNAASSSEEVEKQTFEDGTPHSMPQNAGGYEVPFSPAYDYDDDGCYPTPAIDADGTIAKGLTIAGAVYGFCRDSFDLANGQTYARTKCNNGWCAIIYATYFEKDQKVWGSGGHKHDWEHVISWINQASNQVEYVTLNQGGAMKNYPRSQVEFDGTHPKVVYHKTSASGSHFFRLSSQNEAPGNQKGAWIFPPIVDWNGWPSTELRDKLMNADFGDAKLKFRNDNEFRFALRDAKPTGIPFDPDAAESATQ